MSRRGQANGLAAPRLSLMPSGYSMIRIVAIALVLGVAGAAAAQTSSGSGTSAPAATAPPRPITGPAARAPSSAPPPVSTSSTAGQNAAPASSFTEAEARTRIEAHGYSNVSGLQKDAQSIWRGTALKNGRPVSVALDYHGKVLAQ